MKIIYLGTPELSIPALNAIWASHHQIAGVVTQPDRPKGRGQKLLSSPVKVRAQELGVPVIQPQSLKSQGFHNQIQALNADLMVVVAFSILPASLFALTHHGAINLHGSLLPKYRGAAPIQWAIANGDKETGVTVFQLDSGMDHGAILGSRSLTIDPDITSGELGPRLMDLGTGLILEVLNKMETGQSQEFPQDHTLACPAPKLKKEDGKIDWAQNAQTIHNRIRAFNPFPVCFTSATSLGKSLRIYRTLISNEARPAPGHIAISHDRYPMVGCGNGALKLLEVQLEGKPRTDGASFFNGVQDKAGLIFN